MNPKISIIVPVYKVERYLDQCIKSILDQTLTEFELILVNDGSPDQCGEICDDYARKDKRITVIHKENGGSSSARNRGIEIAKGEYIGFVDSDDYIDNNMYSTLYGLAVSNKAQIAACRLKGIYPDKTVVKSDTNKIILFSNMEALDDIYFGNWLRVVVWNKIYHNSLFKDIRFREGESCEDVSFTYLVLHKASQVVYIDAPLYNYRMSENSITRSKFNPRMFDILRALEAQLAYYQEHKLERFREFVEYTYFTKMINLYYWCYKNKHTKIYDIQGDWIKQEIDINYKRIINNSYFKTRKYKFYLFKVNPSLFCGFWNIYLSLLGINSEQYL